MAPHTPIPQNTMDQKSCFGIPGIDVFETHHSKMVVSALGWRPKHPYPYTPWTRKGVLQYLGEVCLKWRKPTTTVWVLGGRPEHPHPCAPWVRKGHFEYVGWVCSKWTIAKCLFAFWGGDPNTHTPANHWLEKAFLNAWDGCV